MIDAATRAALPLGVNRQPRRRLDLDLDGEAERDSEAVESGTQVRRGCWGSRAHGPVSLPAPKAVCTSTDSGARRENSALDLLVLVEGHEDGPWLRSHRRPDDATPLEQVHQAAGP